MGLFGCTDAMLSRNVDVFGQFRHRQRRNARRNGLFGAQWPQARIEPRLVHAELVALDIGHCPGGSTPIVVERQLARPEALQTGCLFPRSGVRGVGPIGRRRLQRWGPWASKA
jgi:hypothetical protein